MTASEYMKQYNQRPEVRKRRQAYAKLPEVVARRKVHQKKYRQKPEVRERAKEANRSLRDYDT